MLPVHENIHLPTIQPVRRHLLCMGFFFLLFLAPFMGCGLFLDLIKPKQTQCEEKGGTWNNSNKTCVGGNNNNSNTNNSNTNNSNTNDNADSCSKLSLEDRAKDKTCFPEGLMVLSRGVVEVRKVVRDLEGNLYVLGKVTKGLIDFGKFSASNGKSFLAKLSVGGVWQWISPTTANLKDVVLDSKGDIYVVGDFEDSIGGGSSGLVSEGKTDVFVSKWSKDLGKLLWRKRAGGQGTDTANGIAIFEKKGETEIFVTGSFQEKATFGNKTHTSKGGFDVFVAGLVDKNDQGEWRWSVRGGGQGDDVGASIGLSRGGILFVVGNFAQGASFGSTFPKSLGNSDVFVASLNQTSNGSWEKLLTIGSRGSVRVQAISNKDLYLVGTFREDAYFYNESGNLNLKLESSDGNKSLFAAKFDLRDWRAAKVFASGKTLEPSGIGVTFRIDALYITGHFLGTLTTSEAKRDTYHRVFVEKLRTDTLVSLYSSPKIVDGSGDVKAGGVVLGVDDTPFVVGTFRSNVTVGETKLSRDHRENERNLFVWKMPKSDPVGTNPNP